MNVGVDALKSGEPNNFAHWKRSDGCAISLSRCLKETALYELMKTGESQKQG